MASVNDRDARPRGMGRIGVRWLVAMILALVNIVAYIDRVNLAVATPMIMKEFDLDAVEMGTIMSIFFVGYALMNIAGGVLADRQSAKLTINIGLFVWSVFTCATGLANSYSHLILLRFGFGLGEGVLPPGNSRMVFNWFKPNERAIANAFWLGGMQLGMVVGGPLSAWIVTAYGWRVVFYVFGFVGLTLTLVVQFLLSDKPHQHRLISREELDAIVRTQRLEINGGGGAQVSLLSVLQNGWVWVLGGAYFCILIMWWANMNWMPSYLIADRKLSVMQAGIATALPYIAGTVGIFSGGWLSDRMLGGLRTPPIIFAMVTAPCFLLLSITSSNILICIASFSISNFLGAGATAIFWSLPMELYDRSVVGTTGGIMLTFGTVSGMCAPIIIGYFVKTFGSFLWGFSIISTIVLIGTSLVIALYRLERQTKKI